MTNYKISNRARKIVDNEAPFKVIQLAGGREVRLYYTPRPGMYGHQVLVTWFDPTLAGEYITGGCGYCKESEALWHALRSMGIRPRGVLQENPIDYKYHVGGNFYRVNKKDTLSAQGAYKIISAKISKERK